MKKLGLKNLLVLSVMLLVSLSVSISSFVLYQNKKQIISNLVISESENYVASEATSIQSIINEKIGALSKLAQRYKTKPIEGSPDEIIEQTHFLAGAMNLGSSVIAFDSGDGYWNQSSGDWVNNKYQGDVTQRPWYQGAKNSSRSVTVSEPYMGPASNYWISLAGRVKGGVITGDMKLEFLDDVVKQSNKLAGADAFILNHDSTILASSSKLFKTGEKSSDYTWFNNLRTEVLNSDSTRLYFEHDGQNSILFSQRIELGDKSWFYVIKVRESVAMATVNESGNKAIIVTILATVISMIIAYLLILRLYRPILTLKETVLSLSAGEGDLSKHIAVNSDDDLGKISQGINDFMDNLRIMILEIQSAASNLQMNVERLHSQSARNGNILQNHLTETELVVTAIEEMSAAAVSMATDAANTAALTQRANQTSAQSRQIVEKSQQTVSALISDVESSTHNAHEMNIKTENINSILSVIRDIAEQTNLLALNAAIEAARAGEQGRGFAVVADEVRNLASRTKDSTEEVESALTNLLQSTQVVVDSMGNTKNRCQDTAEDASQVADSLQTMTSFVDEIHNLSGQIATGAEEQSSVTQELSRNMSAINEIIKELGINGEQAQQDTKEIAEVNQQLFSIIRRFKLQ